MADRQLSLGGHIYWEPPSPDSIFQQPEALSMRLDIGKRSEMN